MKIATFNINGVNGRFDNLLDWLATEEPDVVCLQELKADQNAFPEEALDQLGYSAVWVGQLSWNGVAILAKGSKPVPTRSRLPGDPQDVQARYVEAAVQGVLVGCLYLPNGNPSPGPKFAYKLAWFDRLISHAADLLAANVPVVLAGDFNVVPTPEDIYPNRSMDGNALISPEARGAYLRLIQQGWTDSLKTIHPNRPQWTFWDYKRDRWANDKGMRIDHILLSPELREKLIDAGVDRWVRGEAGASDHAPAWVELDV